MAIDEVTRARSAVQRDVIREMIDAYNAHDLERCLTYCVPDVQIENADGQVLWNGHAGVRAFYEPVLAQSPALHAEVLNRMHVGEWDVLELQLTGFIKEGSAPEQHAMQIFRVVENKVVYSRILG
jgi:uncharacterized protein (TIGR02246 family)